ncbi:MAG: metallophosphoesterase [Verrucomicrobia bacterium]|nr:metallophosphoesterase [Verrucomicrobiota bacterium]
MFPFSVVADDPYFHNFSMPTNGEAGGVASGNQSYYSFDYADVHFISLNGLSRDLRQPNSEMFQWLARDLAATTQRWKIAYWHTPPYTKGSHNSDSLADIDGAMVDMRENFVPILETYDVDLVLNGHSHVYERTYLLNGHYGFSSTFDPTNKVDGGNGREDGTGAYLKPSDRGAVYVTAGVGSYPFSGPLNHPAHVVKFQGYAGSCLMDVNSNRLDYRFIAADGTVMDHFTLLKGASQSAPPAVPANFQATSYGSSAVLTWNDNATNEMSYSLECSVNGAPFGELAVVGANLTTFTNSGLNFLANTYQYRIRSWNNAGYSDYSATAGVTPPPPPPILLVRGPYLQSSTTTNVVIRWRTDGPTDSRVRFGLAIDALSWEVSDPALTNEHLVTLTNLFPDTKYFYAIGSSATNLAGGLDCFLVSAPTNAEPTRVWVTGDTRATISYGTHDSRQDVRDACLAFTVDRPADLLLNTGDLADMGLDEELQEAFFDVYAAPLRHTAAYACLGNHDLGTAGGQAFLDSFSLPSQGEAGGLPSGSERYYSLNHANVHFVVLDDYGPRVMELGSLDPAYLAAQLDWLLQDLSSNTCPWIIAMFHSPPYTKGSHDSDSEWDSINTRTYFVPVLESFGVDLVLCGHSHNYERSFLIKGHYGNSTTFTAAMKVNGGNGREDGDGPYYKPDARSGAVYVVVGCSGFLGAGTFGHPAMFYSANALGSLLLDIQGDKLLARFLRDTGAIDDYFTIIKGPANASFRITSIQASHGAVLLRWNTTPGKSYQVYRRGDLGTSSWRPVSGILLADGSPLTWQDDSPPLPTAFYRVASLSP